MVGELPVSEPLHLLDQRIREERVGGAATLGDLGADADAGFWRPGEGADNDVGMLRC